MGESSSSGKNMGRGERQSRHQASAHKRKIKPREQDVQAFKEHALANPESVSRKARRYMKRKKLI